jgi:hypothetical protein
MQVNTVHSTLGWFGSRLQTETRSVYHYDKGNDVVVVERRYIDMSLYDHRAVLPATETKGRTIDVKA